MKDKLQLTQQEKVGIKILGIELFCIMSDL